VEPSINKSYVRKQQKTLMRELRAIQLQSTTISSRTKTPSTKRNPQQNPLLQ